MNNNQFRRLVYDTPAHSTDHASTPVRTTSSAAGLGGKRGTFAPMTPRPGAGSNADFARQVRERHAALQPGKSNSANKRFKSVAPKGSKFGAGYTDRAKARAEAEADGPDEKGERIRALEEQAKLGQISRELFESLRDEITGGDVASTHLVKGLDRKLLERVRRGEDVLGTRGDAQADRSAAPQDVDDELDRLQEQDVQVVQREKVEKKGSVGARPPRVAGVKRSRDAILAELKAQRLAAAEAKAAAAAAQFDERWRAVGQKDKPKIEIDKKGREVLIMVDENGKTVKKIRKPAAAADRAESAQQIAMPDASKPVLGADAVIPDLPKPEADDEDEDEDIFAGVGTEYNPLGDDEDDDDDDDDDNDDDDNNDDNDHRINSKDADKARRSKLLATKQQDTAGIPEDKPTPAPEPADVPRQKYFNDTTQDTDNDREAHFRGIEAVLKKAAAIGAHIEGADDDHETGESKAANDARLAKRAQMLAQQDRDLDDMDLGFGSSRYEDEDDGGEGKKMRLSQWKAGGSGAGDDDGGWEAGEKSGKKKRKTKKRKGDVNNAADILRVIERRKAGEK